jgi:hypothetical protein
MEALFTLLIFGFGATILVVVVICLRTLLK